jgi:hypothetical protein
VEVAKRLIDGVNRRDLDLASEPSTPGLEWIPALGAVEGEVFRGREGIETYYRCLLQGLPRALHHGSALTEAASLGMAPRESSQDGCSTIFWATQSPGGHDG